MINRCQCVQHLLDTDKIPLSVKLNFLYLNVLLFNLLQEGWGGGGGEGDLKAHVRTSHVMIGLVTTPLQEEVVKINA